MLFEFVAFVDCRVSSLFRIKWYNDTVVHLMLLLPLPNTNFFMESVFHEWKREPRKLIIQKKKKVTKELIDF